MDNGEALPTYSKAFDCFELPITMLNVYGFSLLVLKLLYDYLLGRRKIVKINFSCNERPEIIFGVS